MWEELFLTKRMTMDLQNRRGRPVKNSSEDALSLGFGSPQPFVWSTFGLYESPGDLVKLDALLKQRVEMPCEMDQEVVERFGPVVDRAIATGSTDELEAMLRLDLPPNAEERVLSILPRLVEVFHRLRMTARADLVQRLWLKLSCEEQVRSAEDAFRSYGNRSKEEYVDRFQKIPVSPSPEVPYRTFGTVG